VPDIEKSLAENQRAVNAAAAEVARFTGKMPFWSSKVADAEKALADATTVRDAAAAQLNEVKAGHAAAASRLASAEAALTTATTKRDDLIARVEPFMDQLRADADAAIERISRSMANDAKE
jgi:chromosome segregation ATPase